MYQVSYSFLSKSVEFFHPFIESCFLIHHNLRRNKCYLINFKEQMLFIKFPDIGISENLKIKETDRCVKYAFWATGNIRYWWNLYSIWTNVYYNIFKFILFGWSRRSELLWSKTLGVYFLEYAVFETWLNRKIV